MEDIRKKALLLNLIDYRVDQLYYDYEYKHNIKDSELCLMYALGDGMSHSQKQICTDWHIPKTTLNTIIKQWEKQGYLTLCQIPGKRRELNITLTQRGMDFITPFIKDIYNTQETALENTLNQYPEFLDAFQYYEEQLRQSFKQGEEIYENEDE